jgi:hypothetical protein
MNFILDGNYQPLLTLFWGVLGWLSALGVGLLLLDVLRIKIAAPWRQVTALLLGLLTLSGLVQALSLAGWANKSLLLVTGAIFALSGIMGIARTPFQFLPAHFSLKSWPLRVVLGMLATALLVNLLVALAPSTKNDEIYYHMLLPQRIVADGGLHFYRQPWEAAIYPQMLFQIAAAPFYAVGVPDSFNVLSWCTSLTLSWLVAYLLLEKADDHLSQAGNIWAIYGATAILVGMYPVVWYVTAGAHAFGDLAVTALIVLIYSRKKMVAEWGPRTVGFVAGVLGVAAAASKVSLLPLAGICLVILLYVCWEASRGTPVCAPGVDPQPDMQPGARAQVCPYGWAMLLPWVIFYLPILVWTYLQSGSPFGPILAGIGGGRSIYPVAEIQSILAYSRTNNQTLDVEVLPILISNYSPLIWVGLLYGLFSKGIAKIDKLILFGLLFFQMLLIVFLLPYDLRFLGGIPYGILCVAGLAFNEQSKAAAATSARYLFSPLLLLIPWLAVQIYYAIPFMQVTLGFTSPATWCEQKIPLCEDIKKLDTVLPPDAQLLAAFRMASVYAPRSIYYDIYDTRPEHPVYAIYYASMDLRGPNIGKCARGALVYTNLQSRFVVYRTPQKAPLLTQLRVYALNCP